MKKNKFAWGKIAIIVILVVMAALLGGMYLKLVELTSQIAYLQDTTNIILSDVGGMENTFIQTLQEETGMVEHYEIRMVDMDFAADTYEVSVYMIPKEYTDNTTVSVYFGTRECVLEKEDYAYTGTITLPLDNSFDGNLTFLFADGKKKNTEVYSNYSGIRTYLDEVLSAGMQGTPKYADGTLSMDGNVSFALDGYGQYEFDNFALVALWNEEEVWTQEITEQLLKDANDSGNSNSPLPDLLGEPTTEAIGPAAPITEIPLSVMAGSVDFAFSYEAKEAGELRIYLRAVTTEGYRFEYGLFGASLVENEPEGESEEPQLALDEESFDREISYVVYDKKGGKHMIR